MFQRTIGEPTKFGLIFTKQTFLKMTYRTHTIITHSKPTINSKNWANFYLTGVSCFLIFSYMNLGMYNIHKSNQQSKFWNWHFLAKFHPHDFDLVSIPTQCSVVAVELDRIFSNKKTFQKNLDAFSHWKLILKVRCWHFLTAQHKTQYYFHFYYHLFFENADSLLKI